jgi:hypothetical protein
MAFSPEQKAQIKARALELIEIEGISQGAAAQRAIAELFSTEEIQQAFAPPQPQVEETRTPDVQDVDVQLRQEEATYLRERTRQLVREGFTEQDAEAAARRDLEQSIRAPAPLGFGTAEERREGGISGAVETVVGGVPTVAATALDIEPPVFERLETPIAEQAEPTPSGIQFDKLQDLFEEQLELSPEEASAQVSAFRTYILEPRLEKIRSEGGEGQEADQRALEQSFEVLSDLNTRLTDENTFLQPEEGEGSGDQWIRAFSRQTQRGAGVPDLTPEQREYLNATIEADVQRQIAARLADNPTKTVIRNEEGVEIPFDADAARGMRGPLPEGTNVVQVPLTEEDVRAEIEAEQPKPWWLTEQREAIIADPEAFEERGFFTTTTPFGTQKEALGGFLLRSALALPNAFAGAAMELGYVGDLAQSRSQLRQEAGYGEGYTGAILQNIAESRGFMGEAVEAADLASVRQVGKGEGGFPEATGEVLYGFTKFGGFAGDLLDPSIDIAKGATTFAKAGVQNTRALRSVYGGLEGQGGAALRNATAQGFNDFLDHNIVATFTNRRFDAGDFRNLVTQQVTTDLRAQAALLEAGGDARAAYNALDDAAKQSVFGRRFQQAIDEGATVEQTLARMPDDPISTAGRAAVEDVARIAQDPTLSLQTIRRRDVARSLGAAARTDEGVQQIVRSVFEGDVPLDGTKLTEAIAALRRSPQQYRIFETALLNDVAAREVAKATKNIGGLGFDNIVAVTKNTFTNKGTARKLLDDASKTDIGKLGKQLENAEVVPVVASRGSVPTGTSVDPRTAEMIGETAPRVLPAYRLSDEQVSVVARELDELQTFGKLDAVTANLMRRRLRDGVLLLEDYRKLLDANIDLLAEGGRAGRVVRSRDLARLPVGEQVELLMPMEQRSFTRTAFRKIYEYLTNRTPKLGNLSIGQRQLLQQARSKMSALDTELRRSISRMQRDEAFRNAYGVPENATVPEIVGALIVGPRGGRATKSYKITQQTIEGILNDLFFSKTTKENVFDLFTGTSVSKAGNVFTEKAMERLKPLIAQATERSLANGTDFFANLAPVIAEAQAIVRSGDPTLLRRPAEEITDVFAKNGNKIPAEVQLGGFYRAEGKRISEEIVSDLINTEVGKGRISIYDELTPDLQRRVASTLGEGTKLSSEMQNRFIMNRARRILNGQPGVVDATDVLEVYSGRPVEPNVVRADDLQDAERFLQNRRFAQDFHLMSEVGEDVARAIIRRNDIRAASDPVGDMEKLIAQLNDPDTEGFKRLNLLFGEDVARQLTDELTAGFDKLRDEIMDLLDKGAVDAAVDLAKGFQNLRYFLLLNLRLRFHGANLLTGADIVYSTTGRLPDLGDIVEAIKVIRNKNPNEIIDVGGRKFTVDELNQVLTTGAGQTVYRAALSSADQQRLLELLSPTDATAGRYTGTKLEAKLKNLRTRLDQTGVGELAQIFKDLPQTEDMLFRYAAMKGALKQGRTLEEAVAVGRRSMFDVSDVSDFEKGFKKLALFYGFQRNNIANAIRNAFTMKGIKRIGKAERFRQNLTDLLLGEDAEETRLYSPSYAQSRVLFEKIGFDPEKGKDLLLVSPPLASLDAIYALADVLKGQPQGLFGGAIRSEYKALLGVEDKFAIDPDEIPAEHIAILQNFADPLDAINLLLVGFGASPTSYVPTQEKGKGREIEGREGRYRIPLTTPKQKAAYRNFMTALAWSGLASPVSDYARGLSINAQGTKLEDLNIRDRLAYLGAGRTPITTITPEQQAYYDRVSRLRQLQALNRTLEKDETERMRLEITEEERERGEQIEERVERRQEQRAAVRRQRRTVREIGEEMRSIAGRMRRDPANYAVYRERILELREEMAEAKAREAAQQRIE